MSKSFLQRIDPSLGPPNFLATAYAQVLLFGMRDGIMVTGLDSSNQEMAMVEQATDGGHKRSAAPYVGYPSYKNMLGGFKVHILPGRIDRSVLGNFSGIVGSQLLHTLRFFNQIDQNGRPTPDLQRLIEAHGTELWTAELEKQLRQTYAPVFELDLRSASPAQFTETFKSAFPAEGDTLRKGLTFFLNAARDAAISVSAFITKNKKPRAGASVRKPRSPKNGKATEKDAENGLHEHDTDRGGDDFKRELLTKFPAFDPSWPDNIKAEWFKGFDQFMAMAKK